jgi:hypothetical protein
MREDVRVKRAKRPVAKWRIHGTEFVDSSEKPSTSLS